MRKKWNILCVLLALLLLSGCSLRTLDELYQVPKRSDEYNNLQSAIDRNLGNREYCAPLSGENLQAVQMRDLDGDGNQEYLLFTKSIAKTQDEKPLQILIFRMVQDAYVLADTIQSYGSAFDLVQYGQIDDQPGYELVVGCQISQQLTRSVSVYCFREGKAQQLMNANYTRFVSCDMNTDGHSELLVLRSGESDEDNGLAELYTYSDDGIQRSNQVRMSASAQDLKRITAGKLHGGQSAVYVASTLGENTIVTDVFAMVDGTFTNISLSKEGGTSVQTLKNYYVYPEDINSDGIMELPSLVNMRSPRDREISALQYLIRWYSMAADGSEIDKLHTFHNFQGGWYMTLDSQWADRVAVLQIGSAHEFFIWNEDYSDAQKILTVYYLAGTSREELAAQDNRFVIYESETVLYAANLDVSAVSYGITPEFVINSFHLIHPDWKNAEQEVSK